MRTIKFFILFAFLACIFSCSQDDQIESLDQLENDSIEKRQVTIANWEPASCVTLKIRVDGNCVSNWSRAVRKAILEFNKIPDVSFKMESVSNGPADIVVNCVDFGPGFSNLYGLSEIPTMDGQIGNDIYLNTDFDDNCTDVCWFQSIVMHELAHNLGILHNEENLGSPIGPIGDKTYDNSTGGFTYTFPDLTITAMQIAGTSQGSEIGSVFNTSTADCSTPNCTFTANDILALQTLYPLGDPCECLEAIDYWCECPEVLDDPCDCPESIENICDCPDNVTDPCDCPELFPEETEVKCYCVCYGLVPKEETRDFETVIAEIGRAEIDCDPVSIANCTQENTSVSYCEVERVCTEVEIVEEEECFCSCTIESSIHFPEPLTWEFIIDCNKPQECDSPNANANCRIIRR